MASQLLAAAFFRAGYIESWGRGIEKIKIECKTADAREPEIKYDFGGVMVTFTGEVPVTSDDRAEGAQESSVKGSVKGSGESSVKTTGKKLQESDYRKENTEKAGENDGEMSEKTTEKTTEKLWRN